MKKISAYRTATIRTNRRSSGRRAASGWPWSSPGSEGRRRPGGVRPGVPVSGAVARRRRSSPRGPCATSRIACRANVTTTPGGDLEVDVLSPSAATVPCRPAGRHDRGADGQGLLQFLRLGLHALALPRRAARTAPRRTGRSGRSGKYCSTTGVPLYRARCSAVRCGPGAGPLGYVECRGLCRRAGDRTGRARPRPDGLRASVSESMRRTGALTTHPGRRCTGQATDRPTGPTEQGTATGQRPAEVAPGRLGGHPAAGGAGQQAGPDQERLADLLDRLAAPPRPRRRASTPDRTAAEARTSASSTARSSRSRPRSSTS